MKQNYLITMPDNSVWCVPVMEIAKNRAAYHAEKDGISFEKSLNEDTIPLFEEDDYEIQDWARNNMDWEDVRRFAVQVEETQDIDYQEGWVNGKVEID